MSAPTLLGTGFVTKPRWDKYDGYVGNFRAPLAAAVTLATKANRVLPVGLDSNGAVVLGGAGQTGICGVAIIAVGTDMQGNLLDGGVNTGAGDVCDVGKHGEIVNFQPVAANGTLGTSAAGTNYYGHPDGSITATCGADGVYIGHTVEATRLIVNVVESLAAPASAATDADVAAVAEDLATLSDTVDTATGDIDTLETSFTSLDARVTALEGA